MRLHAVPLAHRGELLRVSLFLGGRARSNVFLTVAAAQATCRRLFLQQSVPDGLLRCWVNV